MRTPLLILLLAAPLAATAGSDANAHDAIVELCEYRWPEFRRERHQCVQDQWRAYAEVASFAAAHCIDADRRTREDQASSGNGAAALYVDCEDRWLSNYRALASCLTRTAGAVRTLQGCDGPAAEQVVGLVFAAGCPLASASIERARRLLRSTDRGKALSGAWHSERLSCLIDGLPAVDWESGR